jgi:DNA polymerase I-like protein with 3'-5' exonuclease and polymerase domains
VSGRFSSSDPNLQNIPARDPELGPLCRSLYIPEEGELWAAEDYSSQEPRLTVHFANIAKLNGGDEAAERYNTDPNTDYHQFTAELCGIPRKEAKIINLGLAYGMGEAKLCHELGIPTEMIEIDDRKNPGQKRMLEVAGPEGKALLEKYHNKMPFMKGLTEMCTRRANIKGYIKTLLGRRCRFPKKDAKGVTIPEGKPGGTRWFTYKAMNRLIQGSAADQMKAAMLAIYREGKVPLITVHDEIGLSVKDEKEARHWAEVMENSSKITVPNKVDVEIGVNWGDSMK